MREKRTHCLVIGSGIAGLSAALELADQNNPVTVITAAPDIVECNTSYAQGGIIYQALQGDPDALQADILEAGCNTNYRPAVKQLATLGPQLVREILIEKAGVPFDSGRVESGPDHSEQVGSEKGASAFHLTREGGHSQPRILHKGDESGKSIHQSLFEYCRRNPLVEFQTHTTAVNLLMSSYHGLDRSLIHEPARCFGAFVFDQQSGEVYPIFADHTVLATGGTGQLFLHNTNSKFARGDGIALADRAGCRLENLEYVQFHPTTFYKRRSPRFLISEALRGEGAVLLNESGERFLRRYLPDYSTPELAPRDRVARAIHLEMLSGGAECVYLDISHKPESWIRDRFPFVYRSCLKHGVDITKQPVPVVPGRTTTAAAFGPIWTAAPLFAICGRLGKWLVLGCTGLTGLRAPRFWKVWCGGLSRANQLHWS